MKKLLVLLVFILGLSQMKAQEKGDVEVGVLGGLNVSTLSGGDNDSDYKSRVGANFGLSGDYYFSDQWSLRVKLLSDGKGAKEVTSSGNVLGVKVEEELIYRINYLSIPIMANFHFGGAEFKNFSLNLGPYMGFLSSAEKSYRVGILESESVDVKEDYNGFDFGLAFGLGYKFRLSDPLRMFLEYGGQLGFVDILKDNEGDSVKNFSHSFNIGLSYVF